jgi:glycosyltransferase involved in cell wall biosynthesis
MTKKKRKLIFFWSYLEWGGAQVYMMAIMKEAKRDWDVVVVLPRASSPEIIGFLDQIGVKCEFLDFHLDLGTAPTIKRKLERQWSRWSAEVATLRFLRRYELPNSILHIETNPWQSWIFLTILSLQRANVFVTMHNAISTKARWRELVWKARMQFVSRLSGFHIFASNRDTKNKVRHLVEPRFWGDIAVTYTCVDPEQIAAVVKKTSDVASLRKRHGLTENDFVVLCVGQFIDRKGRWVFLDAAKIVANNDPNIKFVWLTPVPPVDEDNKHIGDYGLSNFRLIVSNTVGSTREEILEFFRVADVFVLPSFVEGLPIALLEAMALGLPSISTNVFAIPEAIHHGETGILVEAGDANALAGEIINLKHDPSLRQRLSETGSRYVLANFDERMASQIAISKYKECFDDAG